MSPREFLWCSGVIILLLMMGVAFTGAQVRRVAKVFLFKTNWIGLYFLNLFFVSLLRKCLVMPMYTKIVSKEMKEFILAFKISVSYFIARIDVVNRPVQAIDFLTLTYTCVMFKYWFLLSINSLFIKMIHVRSWNN